MRPSKESRWLTYGTTRRRENVSRMDSHRPGFDGVRFCGGAFWPLPTRDPNHSRRLCSAAPPALTLARNGIDRGRGGCESIFSTAPYEPAWRMELWSVRRPPSLQAGCYSGFVLALVGIAMAIYLSLAF